MRWRHLPLCLAVGGACGALPAAAQPAAADADNELPVQVFQRSRITFEMEGGGRQTPGRAALAPDAHAQRLNDLARGTLLRARLNEDATLALRWRGRRIGLYLTVQLPD